MADTNLSVLLHGKNDLRLVQIRINSVGICGSDVHNWKAGELGSVKVTQPTVLGHESSGTVSKLGKDVTDLKVGDRVAVEPIIPCDQCDMCMHAHYNVCPHKKVLSLHPTPGALKRIHVHPADRCHKLPDNVTFEGGAMAEPLSVAVHACKMAPVSIGHKVLICGAGPIGLLNMFVARAMGASEICVTDISASRLDIAEKLGAHHTVLVDGCDAQRIAKEAEEVLSGKPHVTLECSGVEASIQTGIYATRSKGVLMLIGLMDGNTTVPLIDAAEREITIKGSFGMANDYPTSIAMMASGSVDVLPLITHRFKLEEAVEAFRVSSTGEDGAIKVMIKCSQQE